MFSTFHGEYQTSMLSMICSQSYSRGDVHLVQHVPETFANDEGQLGTYLCCCNTYLLF